MTVFLTPVIFLYKELLKCLVLLKSAFFLQIGILLFSKKPVTNLMKNVSVLIYIYIYKKESITRFNRYI